MRDINEWYTDIKNDDALRETLLENYDEAYALHQNGQSLQVSNFELAVRLGFDWDKSTEGADYWRTLVEQNAFSNIEFHNQTKTIKPTEKEDVAKARIEGSKNIIINEGGIPQVALQIKFDDDIPMHTQAENGTEVTINIPVGKFIEFIDPNTNKKVRLSCVEIN